MNATWFKRIGWFYLPIAPIGFVLYVLAAIFCVTVFRAIDRHSHSATDTLYGIFPFFTCTFLLVDWVARRTSGERAS